MGGMTDIDLDALEAVAAASGAIATAPVLDLIARVRELEAIVNDGGNQAAKYYRRMREAEREMHARELHHFEEEKLRAEAEAERDRYRAEAESARKTGERILADALRYRAAIHEALYDGYVMTETPRRILTRALNEGAADV